ncbi:MAG TPA: hypothetical protein VFQ45_13035 [Longimicrobium sp.]|nr:hypothetical protein [Longimicrobium sp.]
MAMRSRRWGSAQAAVLACILALAACGDGDSGGGRRLDPSAATAVEDTVLPDSTIQRMRRDSLRAFRESRRNAAAAQQRAREQAGIVDDQPPLEPPPSTGEEAYRSCMAQAAVAEGHIRARIEQACENARKAQP